METRVQVSSIVTTDALEITQRAADRLADDDAAVFGGVVKIDVQIADGTHFQIDQRMTRQLFEHVVEETDAGLHVILTCAVQIERDEDLGFLGLALDGGHAAFVVVVHVFCPDRGRPESQRALMIVGVLSADPLFGQCDCGPVCITLKPNRVNICHDKGL